MCIKLPLLTPPVVPPQLRLLLPSPLWLLAFLLMLPHPLLPLLLLFLMPYAGPPVLMLPRPGLCRLLTPLMMRLRWPPSWESAESFYYPRSNLA